MKNIQTVLLKFVLLLPITLSGFNAIAAETTLILKKADSLFINKQYTQSFVLYEQLVKGETFSPAMLLKMAYIQEGLGHLSQSLYYLNLYASLTNDVQAEAKISEVASKNNLKGYENSPSGDHLFRLVNEHKTKLSVILISFCASLMVILVYQKFRRKKTPMVVGFIMLLFVTTLFWLVNLSDSKPLGIVAANGTYLMDGPSSGSSVVAIVDQGHRLTIAHQYDVWLKVNWNGKEVFIKQNELLPLQLN